MVRARGRVERDVVGTWMATHHADCSAGLRSNQPSREVEALAGYARASVHRRLDAGTHLRTLDGLERPADDTRLATLVNAPSSRGGASAATRGRRIDAELLAALPAAVDATFDPMPELAAAAAGARDLRCARSAADDFAQTEWADALALIVEPVIRRAERRPAESAATEMAAYPLAHIAAPSRRRRRDTCSARWWRRTTPTTRLSEDELLGNLILLFVRRQETTTNLLGNGLLTLLRHPQALARLRADPQAMPVRSTRCCATRAR